MSRIRTARCARNIVHSSATVPTSTSSHRDDTDFDDPLTCGICEPAATRNGPKFANTPLRRTMKLFRLLMQIPDESRYAGSAGIHRHRRPWQFPEGFRSAAHHANGPFTSIAEHRIVPWSEACGANHPLRRADANRQRLLAASAALADRA